MGPSCVIWTNPSVTPDFTRFLKNHTFYSNTNMKLERLVRGMPSFVGLVMMT